MARAFCPGLVGLRKRAKLEERPRSNVRSWGGRGHRSSYQ